MPFIAEHHLITQHAASHLNKQNQLQIQTISKGICWKQYISWSNTDDDDDDDDNNNNNNNNNNNVYL